MLYSVKSMMPAPAQENSVSHLSHRASRKPLPFVQSLFSSSSYHSSAQATDREQLLCLPEPAALLTGGRHAS